MYILYILCYITLCINVILVWLLSINRITNRSMVVLVDSQGVFVVRSLPFDGRKDCFSFLLVCGQIEEHFLPT